MEIRGGEPPPNQVAYLWTDWGHTAIRQARGTYLSPLALSFIRSSTLPRLLSALLIYSLIQCTTTPLAMPLPIRLCRRIGLHLKPCRSYPRKGEILEVGDAQPPLRSRRCPSCVPHTLCSFPCGGPRSPGRCCACRLSAGPAPPGGWSWIGTVSCGPWRSAPPWPARVFTPLLRRRAARFGRHRGAERPKSPPALQLWSGLLGLLDLGL